MIGLLSEMELNWSRINIVSKNDKKLNQAKLKIHNKRW